MQAVTITQITPSELEHLITTSLQKILNKAPLTPTVVDSPQSKRLATSVYMGANKLMSKSKFYAHIRAGEINLYKLGGSSYVDAAELNKLFHKVELA
ncbi:MAG: hypothetical protein PSX36_06775 [bacterium]|nr:hypothetical protein [bacterium]